MITHEEARELVDKIYVHTDWDTKDKLLDYITQQEQFAKDVARYFELIDSPMKNIHEITLEQKLSEYDEFLALKEKLQKELGK